MTQILESTTQCYDEAVQLLQKITD